MNLRRTLLVNIMVGHPRPNGGVRAAIAATNYQRFGVLDAATGIRIKMRAPVRRPLSAIPRIAIVAMLMLSNAMVPMVIDVNVIEADVIVMIMMVVPSPSVRPPPGLSPGSKP